MGKKWRYGIIFDAGSSGTRLYVYKWKDHAKAIKHATVEELHSLPKIKLQTSEKIRPGVSSFAEKPEEIGHGHLESLIKLALKEVPDKKVADTPVYLMATAGMRLLPDHQQKALLRNMCSYLQQNTKFSLPDCNTNIQVISGETEGLYGWLATNYLLGGFDHPDKHTHGQGHHTYGFLDMGGASAQIAFAPNSTEAERHAEDLKLVRLRTLDGSTIEHRVFTATWLGYGANQARERYIDKLKEQYGKPNDLELPDPCLPAGLRTSVKGDPVEAESVGKELSLLGTGRFDECLRQTEPLLGKDTPCTDEPCLLNGQHVPNIDFDVNHFVGVSEFWHTTHGVFGKGHKTAYDLATYQKNVVDFCTQNWVDIESSIDARKKSSAQKAKNAQEACFKASWLINVLYEGIGIPRPGLEHTPQPGLNVTKGTLEDAKEKGFVDPFQPVNEIDGVEVSWTLGKMVLYAAGQVPPAGSAQPVGFGSNIAGATDFEPAGSKFSPITIGDNDDDDDWDTDELLDKAKTKSGSGFLAFILVLVVLAYFLRKRDRRARWFGKVASAVRGTRRPGSPRKFGRGFSFTNKLFGRSSATYERVLEEGDADQFELGSVDSDENEHSDSSEGSRAGRSSGLATPKLNIERFDDVRPPFSMDRGGLAVRTESRERLVPSLVNAGRRSRAGSPTRLKSPLMKPLDED
ncbi:GDA1/CD39 family protein [Colletotrichum phormii]|uniref:GDA1/CD39 family protein n=1 Tax=Colletotrichum phormii TaxID=359342 RepID=A0AAI9ZQQ3_9PEZI|nr:GDA1/CD39 family protein [Colletotrichum phormii]KAK1635268.1 GDA1/CD39 family protein [Colletotrichum phormii]